jgi:hypothetical protein
MPLAKALSWHPRPKALTNATKMRFEIAIASIPPVAQALLALWFRLDLPIYRRYNPRT